MCGLFHVELMVIGAINTFCAESGLAQRMINACVFAGQNTANRALEGKMYKRAFRALSLENENMLSRQIAEYMKWLKVNNADLFESEQGILDMVVGACNEPAEARAFIYGALWTKFCERVRAWATARGEEHGQIKLELTYMKMFELLFDFYVAVRDSREHGVAGIRSCLQDMTSLAEWANRGQYTRVLPVVIAMFDSVEEKYPSIAKAIRDGTLLSTNNTGQRMGCIALDYALETGTNFWGKKVVIKLASRTKALLATLTSLPEIVKYTTAVAALTGTNLQRRTQRRTKRKIKKAVIMPPRSKKDESDFLRLRAMSRIVKPANPYKGLNKEEEEEHSGDESNSSGDDSIDGGGSAADAIDLASKIWHSTNGNVASVEASNSMLGYPEITDAAKAAMLDKLDSKVPGVTVWSPRSNFGHRNFNTDKKRKTRKKKTSKKSKDKDGSNAAEVFRKFIAINDARPDEDKLPVKALSCVELTYPSSVITFEGLLNKGSGKANFSGTLFGKKPPTFPYAASSADISETSVLVVDLMMHVRQVKSSEAVEHVSGIMRDACKRIFQAAAKASAAHLIICGDNYQKESTLKDAEHFVRGEGEGAQPLEDIQLDDGRGVQPGEYKSILASRTNKLALVALCHETLQAMVKDDTYVNGTERLTSFSTMVGGKASKSTVVLRKGRASTFGARSGGAWQTMVTIDVPELYTKLDEADHMIVIAVAYARDILRMKRVVVNAGDTDVIVSVLAMEITDSFELGIMTATGASKERIVDASGVQTKIKGQFPEEMRDIVLPALIGLHFFDGGDITSQFDGVPKPLAYNMLCTTCEKTPDLGKSFLEALATLGDEAFKVERQILIKQATSKEICLKLEDGATPTVDVLEHLCCVLHGGDNAVSKVNDLRGIMFASLTARLSKAPPTQNAFLRHLQRVDLAAERYVVAFNNPAGGEPDPGGRGWEKLDGRWWPIGISCEAAPKALIAPNTPCNCNSTGKNEHACTNGHCRCLNPKKGGKSRKCNAACGCKGCGNMEIVLMPEEVDENGEDNVEEDNVEEGESRETANIPGGDAESDESDDSEGDDCAVHKLLQGEARGKGFRFEVEWAAGEGGKEYKNEWLSKTDLKSTAGMTDTRLDALITRCARRTGKEPSSFGITGAHTDEGGETSGNEGEGGSSDDD